MDPVDGQDRRAAKSQAPRVVSQDGRLEGAGAIMAPNPLIAAEPEADVGSDPHHRFDLHSGGTLEPMSEG